LSTEIVRRYRDRPSPLVRDAALGWRTGRLDLVLGRHFDLMGGVLAKKFALPTTQLTNKVG
jgi:hypothetical protein